MSVFTPKRLFLCLIAVLIGSSALANHPSPRTLGRMAYDSSKQVAVLFGGRGDLDRATGLNHDSNETWIWTGIDWLQQFPATAPPGRSAHTMVYDANHGRVLLFGGRQEKTEVRGLDTLLSDLWAWQDGNWSLVAPGGSGPGPRLFSGMAYDTDRDVLVVFGGNEYQPLKPKQKTPDLGPVYDTWEFANGTWTRISTGAPTVAKPLMIYDPVQKQTVMMGLNASDAKPVMYVYANGAWQQKNPAKMPTCVNEGYFLLQSSGRYLFIGGVCPGTTPGGQEVFEYDGTTWNTVTIGNSGRGVGQAVTYDTFRDRVILYGGTTLTSDKPLQFTILLTEARRWRSTEVAATPLARSWMVWEADPLGRGLVLYGGLSEAGGDSYLTDSWQYASGKWTGSPGISTAPPECVNPLSTYDTDRNRVVVLCSGTEIYEFDGTQWKSVSGLDPTPDQRRFAALAYDANLKKVVLFGGFLGENYRNDTWLWNGTKWEELDIDNDDRPPHRGSAVMWYDQAQQKTVLYAGIGRPNINTKVTRYSDMWAFDGTRWTKLDVSNTPGMRFRPQVRVNPANGKLLLFGGLRAVNIDEDSLRQFYDNDMWEWDGATRTWTELQPAHRPPPRQNAGMAYDPLTNELILFGGFANAFYFSDVWAWNGTDWRPLQEPFFGPRRRSVR